jgi:dTDP-4-amino-4,6-dideoxygalactose transaminase
MPRTAPEFIRFSPPLIEADEINEVIDTLSSGWLTTGPKTERFEERMKAYTGASAAVAVASCTAALHLALAALEIGPDDGVITSPLTFASTGHVILYQGARPFLIDVEPDTFNLDPEKVEAFLASECELDADGWLVHLETARTVKAILPVHYGGHPCRMDELTDLARRFNLKVVEDAAHAVGASYKGKKIGAVGDVTCFSFYATKNLTTGEGGMILTDDPALADRMRIMSMYGISDARRIWSRYAPKGSWVYDVAELGFKYNMMDIQASLGLHQLAKLDRFNRDRAVRAAVYNRRLENLNGVRTPVAHDWAGHAWHLYPILLDPDALSIGRDDFIEALKERNVGASVLFIPLHYHSYYQRALPYAEGDFPVAENAFRRIVNLPLSPGLTESQIRTAAEVVGELIEEHQA